MEENGESKKVAARLAMTPQDVRFLKSLRITRMRWNEDAVANRVVVVSLATAGILCSGARAQSPATVVPIVVDTRFRLS